jgi:hypothetical protein
MDEIEREEVLVQFAQLLEPLPVLLCGLLLLLLYSVFTRLCGLHRLIPALLLDELLLFLG